MTRLYDATLAPSTLRAYEAGWARWSAYLGGTDPYLRGSSRIEQRRAILGFCGHLVFDQNCTKATVTNVQGALGHYFGKDVKGDVNVGADLFLRKTLQAACRAAGKSNPSVRRTRVLPLTTELSRISREGAPGEGADYRMSDLAMRW